MVDDLELLVVLPILSTEASLGKRKEHKASGNKRNIHLCQDNYNKCEETKTMRAISQLCNLLHADLSICAVLDCTVQFWIAMHGGN